METKRTPVVQATIALDGTMSPNGSLRLDFSHGKQLQLQIGDLNEAILEQAVLHGLKQKLVDAAAISRDPETGRSATVEDKFEAVKAVFDRLLSGQWNATREGGGQVKGGLLVEALCRLYPSKPREGLVEFVAAKTDKEKAALRKNPKVAAIIAQIKAEKGSDSDDDSDELLAELGDAPM